MPEDQHNPIQLYAREGNHIRRSSPEDEATARTYSAFRQKGSVVQGSRITILSRELSREIGDPVRVIHVFEALTQGTRVYVMGPKPVRGEYVDGLLVTPGLPQIEEQPDYPLYDGRVVDGPAIDYNYEVTEYRFDTPGMHSIQWRLGNLVSNTLEVLVHVSQRR